MNIINDMLVDKCFPDNQNARAVVPAYKDKTASGNPITLTDSAENKPLGMKLYGWSKQDGEPSLDNPVEIESAGMRWSTGKNLFDENLLDDSKNFDATLNPQGFWRIAIPVENKAVTVSIKTTTNSAGYLMVNVNGSAGGMWMAHGSITKLNRTATLIPTSGVLYLNFSNNLKTIKKTYEAVGYIQVEYGIEATDYEPYTGGIPKPYGDKVGVSVRGKNLFHVQETNMKKAISWGATAGTKITIVSNRNYSSIAIMNVLPNVTYFIKNFTPEKFSVTRVLEADENEIGYVNYKHSDNALIQRIIRTSGNTTKMYLVVETIDGTAFTEDMLNDIKIMVAQSDVEESYEPYRTPQSTSLITPNGLPGIPVPSDTSGITYTDANGQSWIADEIDLERGKYVQRVWQAEFDGSEKRWVLYKHVQYSGFAIKVLPHEKMMRRYGLCTQYKTENLTTSNEAIWIGVNDDVLYVKNSRFYDASLDDRGLSNFKAHLAANPLVVMTYLDTPIERDLTSAELEEYIQLYSYKPTTVVENDSDCWMDVTYKAGTSGKSKN